MNKITTGGAASGPTGSPLWEALETYARAEIRQSVQRLLEEEVEALLGRQKADRDGPLRVLRVEIGPARGEVVFLSHRQHRASYWARSARVALRAGITRMTSSGSR